MTKFPVLGGDTVVTVSKASEIRRVLRQADHDVHSRELYAYDIPGFIFSATLWTSPAQSFVFVAADPGQSEKIYQQYMK